MYNKFFMDIICIKIIVSVFVDLYSTKNLVLIAKLSTIHFSSQGGQTMYPTPCTSQPLCSIEAHYDCVVGESVQPLPFGKFSIEVSNT